LKTSLRQRDLWAALSVVAVCAALTVPAAQARARHSDAWARQHFAAAERMREALNGRPAADRTRRDYQRVLHSYRTVYMGAPSSSKADPSVVAVAETLVEMGHRFDDDKILLAAVAQYKFLRREYPGSKYRFDGLFTIGEIYKDDLNDAEAARTAFQEFLRRYPKHPLADDARQAIAELDKEAKAGKRSGDPDRDKQDQKADKNTEEDAVAGPAEASAKNAGSEEVAATRPANAPRVTGIRHWSTPDSTRVAVDLESDVKFSAQRLGSPARIVFDLHHTQLASTLVGKSFDLDHGFLKKVRVAQSGRDGTRIILNVDSLSEYDAFLLPNPYRLIIDIHGKDAGADKLKEAAETASAAENAQASSESDGGDDANTSQAKSARLSHEESAGPTARRSVAAGDDSNAAAAANKPPTVVKRIVEADDDDDATEPPAVKRTAHNVKSVAATKASPGELEDDAATADSRVLKSRRNHIVDAPHKSRSQAAEEATSESEFKTREATPTASGDRSLIRALGLKIGKIVIDPGHGGHDTGTIGPNGLEEKDLVLEVSRRLGKLLQTRLGAEVVYTRKNDTFIPLETRTAIANQARADLFLSIHANSSHDEDARGVETYYLNFTSSPEALEVAARENAVSEKSIYELQDLVKKIALKEKIEESREFAWDVQQSLHGGLAAKSPAIRDRGVKKAPFIVLIGANMPSILAEISFVSNPTDERRLATSEYRQRIAESLYRGIAKYVNGLSGVKLASKMDKAASQ
jgi:N-acetylmuramoyl-L-alanine amidase